ncbi:MAG: hypothetical protein QNJ97_17840 [Myxococcota bacterium]|nr:hypothetical protein [Myxococcota bacterium]
MSYERRYAPIGSQFPVAFPQAGGYWYYTNTEFTRAQVTVAATAPPDPPTGFEPGDVWIQLPTKDVPT